MKLRITIRTFVASFCVALSLLSCGDSNPDFIALKKFYDAKTPGSVACLQYVSLLGEAYDALQPDDQPEVAITKLLEKHAARLKTAEEEKRFGSMAKGIGLIAFGLRTLEKDSAVVAYMQICRHQAAGKNLTPGADRVAQARRCEKELGPGNKRKNCVARAFNPAGKGQR